MSEEKKDQQQANLKLRQVINVDVEIDGLFYGFCMPVGGNWNHAIKAAELCKDEVEAQYKNIMEKREAEQQEEDDGSEKE